MICPLRPIRWSAARTALATTERPWLESVPITIGSAGSAPDFFTSSLAVLRSSVLGLAGAWATAFWAASKTGFAYPQAPEPTGVPQGWTMPP